MSDENFFDAEQDSIINASQNKQFVVTGVGQKLVGKTFARYKVESLLGRGGNAEVFKAYHPGLKLYRALKVIGSSSASNSASLKKSHVDRFLREAELSAQLKHPNIVSVYDVGIEQGRHYLIMDYVEGTTLEDVLMKGSLPIEESLKIIRDVAHALHYAHEQAIIHRDIKPSNIMISNGKPLLMDFGMAKPVMVDSSLTQVGEILGTPSYMAPEQAQGRIDEIDSRTDVYALGGVMYAMITKQPPVSGKTIMAKLMAVVSKPTIPPREIDPEIPQAVEDICLKAMQKDPDKRFFSALEMAQAIEEYLATGKSAAAETKPKAADTHSATQVAPETDDVFGRVIPLIDKEDGTQQMGKYHVLKELAHGSVGAVYLAEDTILKRKVAIKVLLSGEYASKSERSRFHQEAQMVAKLSHPNLIEIHEVGVCDYGDFFVMEYFPGNDLDQLLKRDSEKIKRSVNYCCQITEKILTGMQYAHINKVMHRDLKPGNIMIKGNLLKITDFGLAQEFSDEKDQKKQGYMGTPVYSSPEQLKQDINSMDGRSDIYSTGVILYKMLTENLPYTGRMPDQILEQMQRRELVKPSEYNSKIPKVLEEIILKSIALNPAERYQTAEEFRRDLQNFRKGQQVSVEKISPAIALWRKTKKYHIAAVSIVLTLLVIYGYVSLRNAQENQRIIDENFQNIQATIVNLDTEVDNLKYPNEDSLTVYYEYSSKLENLRKNAEATVTDLANLEVDVLEKLDFENRLQINILPVIEKSHKKVLKKIQDKEQEIQGWRTAAASLIEKKEWSAAEQNLVNIQKQLPNDKEAAEQLALVHEKIQEKRVEKLYLTLNITPKDSKYVVYEVFDNKTISPQAMEEKDVSQGCQLTKGIPYILEFRHEGYLPTRVMILQEQIHTTIKRNLIPEKEIYKGMVHVTTDDLFAPGTFKDNSNVRPIDPRLNFINDSIYKRAKNHPRVTEEEKKASYSFLIDKYEVTNIEYKKHLEKFSGKTWNIFPGKENHPVTNVSWKDAFDYAIENGKTLPSSLQWQLAALGYDDRTYPWGDETPFSSNKKLSRVMACLSAYSDPVSNLEELRDISPFGAVNMAGNVVEWTLTEYRKIRDTQYMVIRGACAGIPPNNAPTAHWWQAMDRDKGNLLVGFRCVINLKE